MIRFTGGEAEAQRGKGLAQGHTALPELFSRYSIQALFQALDTN